MTGITGYIGAHVGKNLLETLPALKLKATYRSKEKLEDLRLAYGEDMYNRIEFVEADLQNSKALIEACSDVDSIIHMANPVPGEGRIKLMNEN